LTTSDADVLFELWFANQPPTGQYDAADAYVVVILHLPAGRAPFGLQAGNRSIEGRSWRMWLSERSGAPMISYDVPFPSITEGPLDLEPFVRDAASLPASVSNDMYLTDVHAGFEIWSGGTGLSLTNLSISVE
jgi:hypothetical protein